MNAIDILLRDHKRIRCLLRELTEARSGAARAELFNDVEEILQIHSGIEEDLFYPAVRRAANSSDADELYIKSRDEHKLVDVLLPHLRFVDKCSENFRAKTRLARELVEQHIENEERELLPLAREVLSARALDDLGARMDENSRHLDGRMILAAQSRSFDCDRDGFRLTSPFCTIISGIGC